MDSSDGLIFAYIIDGQGGGNAVETNLNILCLRLKVTNYDRNWCRASCLV